HLEAGPDHHAAQTLRVDRDAIRFGVLVDLDARQELARALVGRGAGDALGADLDGRSLHPLDLDAAVRVPDVHLAGWGDLVRPRPLVGRPSGQVAERHVAAGDGEGQRGGEDEEEPAAKRKIRTHAGAPPRVWTGAVPPECTTIREEWR